MNKEKELIKEFKEFLRLLSLEEKQKNSKIVKSIKKILGNLKKWCLVDDNDCLCENYHDPYHINYGTSYPLPMDMRHDFFLF